MVWRAKSPGLAYRPSQLFCGPGVTERCTPKFGLKVLRGVPQLLCRYLIRGHRLSEPRSKRRNRDLPGSGHFRFTHSRPVGLDAELPKDPRIPTIFVVGDDPVVSGRAHLLEKLIIRAGVLCLLVLAHAITVIEELLVNNTSSN